MAGARVCICFCAAAAAAVAADGIVVEGVCHMRMCSEFLEPALGKNKV